MIKLLVLGCILTYCSYFCNNVICVTTEPRVVSKVKVMAGCVDGSGNSMNDGDSWPSSLNICDNNICFVVFSGIFVVEERCRPLSPTENPDTLNCQEVSDNSKSFPHCCPKLVCNDRVPLTTISPLVCLDMATTFSCEFWRNETSGCQEGFNEVYFNFTRDYCRKTCGFC